MHILGGLEKRMKKNDREAIKKLFHIKVTAENSPEQKNITNPY